MNILKASMYEVNFPLTLFHFPSLPSSHVFPFLPLFNSLPLSVFLSPFFSVSQSTKIFRSYVHFSHFILSSSLHQFRIDCCWQSIARVRLKAQPLSVMFQLVVCIFLLPKLRENGITAQNRYTFPQQCLQPTDQMDQSCPPPSIEPL